ncbi:MAG: UpxY family transcription antiterminator [Mangrovibacterium sp.]
MTAKEIQNQVCWYVMRDLKRSNAKVRAYQEFAEKEIEVFTPMEWSVSTQGGKKTRKRVPLMPDLLFVHSSQAVIDPLLKKTPTTQYIFKKGAGYRNPMTVDAADMQRFVHAVNSTDDQKYYRPEEITPEMYKRKIRIIGGALDGYEGGLITVRGSKVKRLLVELPNFFAVGVEVEPEMIEFI